MQNNTSTLHAQLKHSTPVLDSLVDNARVMKDESGQLNKSVKSLAQSYLKQSKKAGVSLSNIEKGRQALDDFESLLTSVHSQSQNLEICLKAVVKTYKKDLSLADNRKQTRTLKDATQETSTFITHIRYADDLVKTVAQSPAPSNPQSGSPPSKSSYMFEPSPSSLADAYRSVVNNTAPYLTDSQMIKPSYNKIINAANDMRSKIEAPDVRKRLGLV